MWYIVMEVLYLSSIFIPLMCIFYGFFKLATTDKSSEKMKVIYDTRAGKKIVRCDKCKYGTEKFDEKSNQREFYCELNMLNPIPYKMIDYKIVDDYDFFCTRGFEEKKKARYIDVDEFAEEICKFPALDEHCANAVISLLRRQPSADVVEVVRCRSCRFSTMRRYWIGRVYKCDKYDKRWVSADAFCSYGQRRDT